jgi:phosphoserine aminotransferase
VSDARPPAAERWSFTVGPSQLHPAVPGALQEAFRTGLPSWSHRSDAFRQEVAGTVEALSELLGVPDGWRILLLGSATEAMERVAQGVVGGGGRSFHLVNGAFARRFRAVVRNVGGEAGGIEAEDGLGFHLPSVEVPEGTRLLVLTQNETSTGVALDPEGIRSLALRHREVLTAVDAVTALPTQPLALDAVDAAFFSVQKLFGLPAGLGVLIASPRLVEEVRRRMDAGRSGGGFLHLPALAEAADRQETPATPNMLGIHLLGVVARDFLRRGLWAIRRDARESEARIRAAARAVGWDPFPPEERDRSGTVLVFRLPEGRRGEGERGRLRAAGFEVSAGYGANRDRLVRIANFPSHTPDAVDALARAIEE